MSKGRMNSDRTINETRRRLVAGGTAAAGLTLLGAPAIVLGKDRTLVTRDPGGQLHEGFVKAFYEPFKAATGISVIGLASESEPSGMVKAMVDARNYQWDMAHLSNSTHLSLKAQGYLEPIAGAVKASSAISQIPPEMRGECILGVDVYATVIGYRTDVVKTPPKDWKDFFDPTQFRGARALRKNPFDTMEEVLLADGVDPKSLYPLDIERAFKKLSQIKKHVDVWWENGAQSSQLLKTGEVDMLALWNGRAQVAIDDGAPAKLQWNQALWTFEGFTILKGGPKVDMCREFIEFCAKPEQQAIFTQYIPYGPTAPGAFKYIKADRAQQLPNSGDRLKSMIAVDSNYWATHADSVTEKFNSWLLG